MEKLPEKTWKKLPEKNNTHTMEATLTHLSARSVRVQEHSA